MGRSAQFDVTLSDDLLRHLRITARQTHVPLRWLVAGLVCDTLEQEPRKPASAIFSDSNNASGRAGRCTRPIPVTQASA